MKLNSTTVATPNMGKKCPRSITMAKLIAQICITEWDAIYIPKLNKSKKEGRIKGDHYNEL